MCNYIFTKDVATIRQHPFSNPVFSIANKKLNRRKPGNPNPMGRDLKPGDAWSIPEERGTCSEWDSRPSFPRGIRAHRLQVLHLPGLFHLLLHYLPPAWVKSQCWGPNRQEPASRSTRKEGYFGNGLEVNERECGTSKIMLSCAVD